MNGSDFVEAVYQVAYKSTIADVTEIVKSPPGRRPRPALVALSAWHGSLDDEDLTHVQRLIRLSVDHAVFGVLALIDGVRPVDDAHSEIVLRVGRTDVNAGHDLHEIFRSLVDEAEDPD